MYNRSTSQRIAFSALVMSLLIAGSAVAGDGACFSAVIEAPILIPGVGEKPAGELKLCVTRQLSPISALHKTYVDGDPVAMLMSRQSQEALAAGDAPFILFRMDSLGRYQLEGFGAPIGRRMMTYHVGPRTPEVSTWWQAVSQRPDPLPEEGSGEVFISANGFGTTDR